MNGMEIEFKFHIESREQAEDIFDDPEVLSVKDANSDEEIQLHAIYFDTADRRLGREGITFRTRKEGEKYVATLKWNGSGENGLHVREEINIPMLSEEKFKSPDVNLFEQSEMCQVLKDAIGKRELIKRVEVEAVRKQFRIDTGKSICEISYDNGIVINGDKTAPISEMEIELYSGSKEDMEEFAAVIAEKYGLHPENRSKFRQGLELE